MQRPEEPGVPEGTRGLAAARPEFMPQQDGQCKLGGGKHALCGERRREDAGTGEQGGKAAGAAQS